MCPCTAKCVFPVCSKLGSTSIGETTECADTKAHCLPDLEATWTMGSGRAEAFWCQRLDSVLNLCSRDYLGSSAAKLAPNSKGKGGCWMIRSSVDMCWCLSSICTPGIALSESNCELVNGAKPGGLGPDISSSVSSSHPHQLYSITMHTILNSGYYTRSRLDLIFQVEWWEQLGYVLWNTQPRFPIAMGLAWLLNHMAGR